MNKTKERILLAAEELLSSKGAAETTIAEIARKAQVADSHAYQYFKGKNGLVFSIAEKRLKSTLHDQEEQLQGILDSKSRLSKFIWCGLNFNDNHKDYVRNLVFDYRSNLDFYKTPAYELVRKHAQICYAILQRGVEENHFRNDVDIKLVREIIYGSFDAEAMICILTNEIDKSIDDWSDIISIIFSMIEPKEDTRKVPKNLKIIEAAETIFGEFGFQKSKISTVAKAAGVAEGSIYDHFKNKDDLLFSLIQMRLNELDSLTKESFSIKKSVRKLRRLLRLHFSLFAKNRNFLKIFILDTVLNRKFYESKAYAIYKSYQERFVAILEDGIARGDFKQDLNTRVYTSMFIGTSIHMALRWIVFPDKPFDKLYEIDAVTEMFVTAALP